MFAYTFFGRCWFFFWGGRKLYQNSRILLYARSLTVQVARTWSSIEDGKTYWIAVGVCGCSFDLKETSNPKQCSVRFFILIIVLSSLWLYNFSKVIGPKCRPMNLGNELHAKLESHISENFSLKASSFFKRLPSLRHPTFSVLNTVLLVYFANGWLSSAHNKSKIDKSVVWSNYSN